MSPVRPRPNKSELPGHTPLWRYFDLNGALNLLRTNSLKFTQLAEFEDGFEGRQSSAEKVQDILDREAAGINFHYREAGEVDLFEVFNRFHTYASCWTTISPNSLMMWSIYAPAPESIAMETTVSKLCESYAGIEPEILIGQLGYGNRESGITNSYNPLEAIWSKWDYYAHESEVRLNVNANNFNESHDMRCTCREPKERFLKFQPNPFTRIYSHPRMGEDLYEGLSYLLKTIGEGFTLEKTSIVIEPPNS